MTLLPALKTLFLLDCLIQAQYEDFCFALLYLVLSCVSIVSLETRSCLKEETEEGWIWERGEIRCASRNGGRGIVVVMYFKKSNL